MVEQSCGQCRHLPRPRKAATWAWHRTAGRLALCLATILVLTGCGRARVLAGPGLDTEGLEPGQVLDVAAVNDWMRYKGVRVHLADGSSSSSGFVRIEAEQVVWRPRDGNPFRKAPLRHEPLAGVVALERRHRFWPFVGGLTLGAVTGLAAARAVVGDGRHPEEADDSIQGGIITAMSGMGAAMGAALPYLLSGGTVALAGGGVGIRDGVYLNPTRAQLEKLRREAAWRRESKEDE